MPEKIGHYTIVSPLGRGGMGVVYKAHDESLDRFVAIKVLTENLTDDPTFLQRFVREAKAAAGLSHPNIVQIHYIGEHEGRPFFVMEYVAGRSLEELVRSEGVIDNPRASQLVLQAAHGLAAAHDVGIIHRDIKPANLILDDRGLLKIADFGLALPVASETRLTATGFFVGTPGYLSPEQCADEKADHRTDIYALGVTFYLLLTGTPPFKGESPLALLKQILDANPPDVSTLNKNVDAETRRILGKMIAKEREHRYQSCHELIEDLENFLDSRGIRSMTAGLGVRVPSSLPDRVSMEAPTQGLGTLPDVPNSPPKEVLPAQVVAPTLPDTPLMTPATHPAMSVPAAPVRPRRSSSAAVIVAVVLLLLLGGGAIAAVKLGTNVFRGFQTQLQKDDGETASMANVASTEPATAPVASDSKELLLSQAITPPAPSFDTAAQQPESGTVVESEAASGEAQPQRVAQPQAGAVAPSAKAAVVVAPRQPARTPVAQPVRSAAVAPPARTRAGVVVAATGDRNLIGAVSAVVQAEIQDSGMEVFDAQVLPATEDLLRRGDASAKRLIDILRDEGYAVLLLARIDPTGERELSYYGRRDVKYLARVTLTAYDLATGRPLGSSQSSPIEYTSITAESESADVVGPLARASARAIRNR